MPGIPAAKEHVIYRIRPPDDKHPVASAVENAPSSASKKTNAVAGEADLDQEEREYNVVP